MTTSAAGSRVVAFKSLVSSMFVEGENLGVSTTDMADNLTDLIYCMAKARTYQKDENTKTTNFVLNLSSDYEDELDDMLGD